MGVCDCFKKRSGDKGKKENMLVKLEDFINSKGAKNTYPIMDKSGLLTSNREFAATLIQTAFRAYMARKTLRYLKGISRFQALVKVNVVKKQASTVLERLHFWSKIQAEISGRRLCMITQGQMKLEDRMKVESKLHELKMKWWGGLEKMEENTLKMKEIEKATNRRERALAYAFSHQWRAKSNRCFGEAYYDLSKESWGWNWINPWIAVYRWEGHVMVRPIVSPRAAVQKKPCGKLVKYSKKSK